MIKWVKRAYLGTERWYLTHSLWFARRVIVILSLSMIILFVLLLFRDPSLSAQTTPAASPVAAGSSPSDAEVIALKAQLEQMKSSDEKLLQTVYWTLATFAGVAILLVGFSWFSNVRLAEKDRQQMRAEIESALKTKVDEARETLEGQLKGIEDRAVAVVSSEIEKSEKDHADRFAKLQETLRNTQYNLLVSICRIEAPLNNSNVVLRMASTIVKLGIEANKDTFIAGGLDLIQTELNRESASPDAELVATITETLDGLPAKFSTDRDVARRQLTAVRDRMRSQSAFEG